MKGFTRNNPNLSLCGLNCGLCPMHLGGHCGGCGFGNQSCPIARCSLEHGGFEYCHECPEYPCRRYKHIDEKDSFITHRNQKRDLAKIRQIGVEAYNTEQAEKKQILDKLLADYNDGRKKTLFCTAVNLLELQDLKDVLAQAEAECAALPLKERAAMVARLLQQRSPVDLKLRK
ncbi:MAG: DUF3795 domain-containing protein [Lachnospiraceae bacterium]|nr:DUF3795 domain-containing protein [Lachnospiraceae bacterium]